MNRVLNAKKKSPKLSRYVVLPSLIFLLMLSSSSCAFFHVRQFKSDQVVPAIAILSNSFNFDFGRRFQYLIFFSICSGILAMKGNFLAQFSKSTAIYVG